MYNFSQSAEGLISQNKQLPEIISLSEKIGRAVILDWMELSQTRYPKISSHGEILPLDRRLNVETININVI